MRFRISIVFAVLLVASSTAAVVAEEKWIPFSTNSADCETLPPSLADIERLTVEASTAPPPIDTWAKPLPTGRPADDATNGAIEAAVQQFFACASTGNPLQTFALYSDRYALNRLVDANSLSDMTERVAATPEARSPTEATIRLLSPVQLIKNGRILVPVAFYPDATPNAEPNVQALVFTFEDDAWKIDEIITYVKVRGEKVPVAVSEVLPPID